MDWRADIEIDPDVFKGIATTLLALAGLTERLDGLSWLLRYQVLWYLCAAEQVALHLTAGRLTEPCGRHASEPERLAASFRRLAILVRSWLRFSGRFRCPEFDALRTCVQAIGAISQAWPRLRLAAPAGAAIPDTS